MSTPTDWLHTLQIRSVATKQEKEQLLRELRGIRRIVINTCHGGFGLSDKAFERYKELAGIDDPCLCDFDIDRDDPHLVQVVRDMGLEANGQFASLKIVEVPADVLWEIDEYDGLEWVAEQHRTWR